MIGDQIADRLPTAAFKNLILTLRTLFQERTLTAGLKKPLLSNGVSTATKMVVDGRLEGPGESRLYLYLL
jgi:hypothetical protein